MQLKSRSEGSDRSSIDPGGDGAPELSPHQLCMPFFREYALTAEFNLFIKQQLPGIYAIPSSRNPHEWFGILFLRQGLYQGAILRFSLLIPDDFPDTNNCPRLMFEYPIFHPHISPESGELDVKRAFPTWRKGVHHLYQVLGYMQRIFYRIETENPLNSFAARTYESDPEQFRLKVAESVRRTRETVYDPPESSDPNAIRFSPWDTSVHEKIRETIFTRLRVAPVGEMSSPSPVTGLVPSTPVASVNEAEASNGTAATAASGGELSMTSSSGSMASASDEEMIRIGGFPQNAQTSGLSFFDPTAFKPMARETSTSFRNQCFMK